MTGAGRTTWRSPVRRGVCMATGRWRFADQAEAAVRRATFAPGTAMAGAQLLRCRVCKGVHLGLPTDSPAQRRHLTPLR